MNTPTSGLDSERETLLREHSEIVQLFIHEDSMAWRFTFGLLAGNTVILGGVFGIGLLDITKSHPHEIISMCILLGLGILLNIVGFYVLQRSKIHRLSRLFRGYAIEAQLSNLGLPISTFTSCERNIFLERMLSPDGVTTRPLERHEKIEALGFDFVLIVVAILSTVTLLWLLLGRPLP